MKVADDALVVVDYECISPLGSTFQESWLRALNNESGIGCLDRYISSEESLSGVQGVQYAGQIPGSYAEIMGSEAKFKRWPDPSACTLKLACQRLLKRLGFNISQHIPHRLGVIGGNALTSAMAHDAVISTKKPVLNALLARSSNIPLSMVAIEHQFQGPVFNVGSACASSGQALIIAGELIKSGVIDAALVCGFEFPLQPINTAGFSWLSAAYTNRDCDDRAFADPSQASRPFSVDRRGLVLSEGSAALLLTSEAYRKKKGWSGKGIIRGSCMNSDAGNLTSLNLETGALCMREAIFKSGLNISDIECINAHATSTYAGDSAELKCLYNVFEQRLQNLPVIANKSQIGHTLGASSLFGVMFAVQGMQEGKVLPTLNYMFDDKLPEAQLSLKSQVYEHRYTLANSFGFGGANACLVLERFDS